MIVRPEQSREKARNSVKRSPQHRSYRQQHEEISGENDPFEGARPPLKKYLDDDPIAKIGRQSGLRHRTDSC